MTEKTSIELDIELHELSVRYQNVVDMLSDRNKRVAELEDKLANADYQLEGRDNEIAKLEKDLCKARELLKWWVNHCGCHDLHYAKKTEQFLNSEVEK